MSTRVNRVLVDLVFAIEKLLYLPGMKMMDTDETDHWPNHSPTNCK